MQLNIRPVVAPTLTGLTATVGVRTVTLTWTVPNDPTYAKAEIWRSTTNTAGSGTKIATVAGNTYTDTGSGVDPVSNVYYFVRAVNIYGRADGAWSASVTVKSQLATKLDLAAASVEAAMLNVAAISSTTGALVANSVGTTQITDSAITSAKITANAVTAGKIDASAVTAREIAGKTITAAEIAANTITANEIWTGYVYAGTISANQINAGTLSANYISGGSITGSAISLGGGNFQVSSAGVTYIGSPSLENVTCTGYSTADALYARANGSGAGVSAGSGTGPAIAITAGLYGIRQTGGGENYMFDLHPAYNNGYSLGSSNTRWNTVYATTGSINTSDARTKTDIADSDLGLEFINSLRPVKYRIKVAKNEVTITEPEEVEVGPVQPPVTTVTPIPGKRMHYGLISQEVRAAMTEHGIDDAAFWTLDDPTDPDSQQALRYEELISPLIKAVQELSATVESQRARIEQLETKLVGA